jgi:hypothetical protein
MVITMSTVWTFVKTDTYRIRRMLRLDTARGTAIKISINRNSRSETTFIRLKPYDINFKKSHLRFKMIKNDLRIKKQVFNFLFAKKSFKN